MNIRFFKYGVFFTFNFIEEEVDKDTSSLTWNHLSICFRKWRWSFEKGKWNLGFLKMEFGRDKKWN